ncbi:MAG: DUF1016 N-terminal domain-containing protein [Candidatus Accumulibacter meliphilus]|jgi:hypothetical protein|uniref:DUF1016 N-terminal domain-containing protein n=1 Tax=Candidatus Accumulibacter meliphilus TaxID=2211374 RepID=UPI002FC39EAC
MSKAPAAPANTQLLGDIRQIIEQGRQQLASTVNSALTLLYWQIGQRIHSELLKGERAAYGEQIVSAVARQLEAEYGRGFSEKNLRHMLRFAEAFPDQNIVSAVRRQLSWTHIKTLIYIEDPLKRDFYLQMCQQERWSARSLQERLDSLLFERTALSRQPDQLIASELATLRDSRELSPALLLKDAYVLDFLGLRWLAKHEQEPGEAPPLGIILCSGKKQEQIELLELDHTGTHVAKYLTALPPRELLQAKLHETIALSRARLENRGEDA